jgi:hypothetical protein
MANMTASRQLLYFFMNPRPVSHPLSSNTVRILGGCAAGTRKRGNRSSNRAQRKACNVQPEEPTNVFSVLHQTSRCEVTTILKRHVANHGSYCYKNYTSRGFDPRQRIFPLASVSRPALRPP